MDDKRVFVENLILRIRDVNMVSILNKHLRLIRRGRNYFALCPFHNDKSIGSFVVSPDKGIYKCFSCGEGGDAIKFVSKIKNISYIQASLDIGYDLGLISLEEYETYSSFRFRKSDSIGLEKLYSDVSVGEKGGLLPVKKSSKDLNKIYRTFLNLLELSEDDYSYLINERKLSKETIEKRMYRSCDYSNYMRRKITKELIEDLKDDFPDVDFLHGVPGFYQEKHMGEYVWTFSAVVGLIIPILDCFGNVVALQLRKRNKGEGSRYVWFSSSFASYEDSIYKKGASPGSPLDVLYPDKITNNRIFITEGRFKSEQIIKTFNSIAISLQGVGSWKGIEYTINNIVQKYSLKNPEIILSFDADFQRKYSVFVQLNKLSKHIKEKFPQSKISVLLWEYSSELKGIDDFLLSKENGIKHSIYKVDANLCLSHISKQIEEIMRRENLESEWDIEPEHFGETTTELLKGMQL